MGSRQENLRPAGLLAHIQDVGPHSVPGVEVLPRDGFLPPQHRFGAAEINNNIAELDTFDQTIDDLADAIPEFVVLALALGFPDLVDNHLLRGLRGDAAKINGRQGIHQELADLRARFPRARSINADLSGFVFDFFNHFKIPREADFAGYPIDGGAYVVLVAILGAARLLNCLLHGFEDFIAINALVTRHGLGDLQQFRARVNGFRLFR